ncbi:phasin family protein [Sphingomonas jatrophae]|nr:phasin family protein [Sphingomonas jatrophae]
MVETATSKRRGRKPAPAILAQPAVDAEVPPVSFGETAAIAFAPVEPAAITIDALVGAAPTAEPKQEAAPAPVIEAAEPVEPASEITEVIEEQPVASLSSAVAENSSEGSSAMATAYEAASTTADFSDKAKAMFGDFNDRAKSAMEKSAKLGEEMTEFTKGNVEALVTSGRVAAKGCETLAQDLAETMKKNFESATATMKSFAAVKSPTELFQLQSDYARSYFDGAVADASKFSEAMMKLMGDIAQPLSSRYALAAEKIKATAL